MVCEERLVVLSEGNFEVGCRFTRISGKDLAQEVAGGEEALLMVRLDGALGPGVLFRDGPVPEPRALLLVEDFQVGVMEVKSLVFPDWHFQFSASLYGSACFHAGTIKAVILQTGRKSLALE